MNKYQGMMAISIRQPWAWLIVHGHKIIETRSWCPHYDLHNERIAIHAGKQLACDSMLYHLRKWAIKEEVELPGSRVLVRGAVIGSVELSMVREYTDSEMFFGDADLHLCSNPGLFEPTRFGWELTAPEIEPNPYEIKGRLGFFPALKEV